MRKLLLLLLLVAAGVIVWAVVRKNEPPRVPIVRARRQTLVSTLPTNGKVEPFEWQAVRAETAGIAAKVPVQEGQSVAQGAVLATITAPSVQADIDAAEARVAEARAALAGLENGGRPADLTEIQTSLDRSRFDLQQATNEYDALRRLAEKHAATTAEVEAARNKMRQAEMQIDALEKRKPTLVVKTDVAGAQARLQEAQVSLDLARRRASLTVVLAPLSGVVYGLAARTGSYLNLGDLVANVGRLDRLRVRVYVDEPELGRIAEGQTVTLSWQALPSRKWQGTVERKPTSIQALGSRQVGEVLCEIENPGRDLIPGTNVDAEIKTAAVDNALVIPREALRHDATGDFVLLWNGQTLERRPVKTGVSSIAAVQIVEGLTDNESVAMPSDTPVNAGDRITPSM